MTPNARERLTELRDRLRADRATLAVQLAAERANEKAGAPPDDTSMTEAMLARRQLVIMRSTRCSRKNRAGRPASPRFHLPITQPKTA
jgi:hypothetical protein